MPVDGKVYAGKDRLAGSVVTLFKNGQQVQQVVTTSNGKFIFDLPPNAEYIISITKPGYVTKKFKIITANVPPDRAQAGGFNQFQPDVTLFEMPSNAEVAKRVEAILSAPIAVYQYIPAQQNFDYDEKYTQVMQDKLAELEKLQQQLEKEQQEKIKNAALEAQKQMEIDKKYKDAIGKGDKALASSDYSSAKAAYNDAKGIKPTEQYPKDKLVEIDKLMANANAQKATDEKYKAAIDKADKAFGSKDYSNAKSSYTEASGIKPAEKYPKDKLAEIDKLLADAAAANAAAAKQKDVDAKYQAAITKGDNAFNAKDYTNAKSSYTEASGIKPAEKYPKQKLDEIDKILANANAAAAKQKEIDDKYKAAIAKADAAFGSKDYSSAKSGYSDASSIKPAETYPKQKLAEIEKLLTDAAAANAAAAKQKEIDDKYKAAIAKADAAFGSKDYSSAKSSYSDASSIKPAEKYPKDKIAEIDKLLASAEADKQKEKQYADLISKADAAFGKKDYANAKTSYTQASALKPAEAYSKQKISEIDKLLADMAKAGELDKQYKDLISKGDNFFSQKNYTSAKSSYSDASSLKSAEKYPKDKIAEIDKLLAALDSQKSAAEKEQKYKDAIASGDKFFAAKDYASAKSNFTEASGIKPAEQYPKQKIADIDKLLAALDAQKSADAKKKELDEKYKAAISKGDAAFTSKDYATAKTGYAEASGLKPSEEYPRTKLADIDRILKEQAAKQAAAGELEKNYSAAITRGDAAFNQKSYANAKVAYNEALTYKPNEQYPKSKLAEIEKILSAANDEKDKNAKYNAAIQKADNAFGTKNYAAAKSGYEDALAIKPNEQYPKSKLKQIEDIIKNAQTASTVKKEKAPPPPPQPVISEEEKLKQYQSELRAKYPAGVTEEEISEGNKTILRRVVIRDDYAGVYTKVTHNWGGIYCFKDGQPITEMMFDNESK